MYLLAFYKYSTWYGNNTRISSYTVCMKCVSESIKDNHILPAQWLYQELVTAMYMSHSQRCMVQWLCSICMCAKELATGALHDLFAFD